jgi:CRISPR system Cascade subunit CasD
MSSAIDRVLLFTLAAPLAAFGELAGSKRGTQRTPTFSGIVGLLGAAIGIERGDDRLFVLAQAYAMAVRVERDAGVLSDFHTVETPHNVPKRGYMTRRDELGGKTGLVPTRRDYRQDVEYTIALFPIDDTSDWPLESLVAALQNPRYPLYAGRRSCQLSQPPNPKIVEATTVSDALGMQQVVYDGRLNGGACQPHHSVERQDFPLSNRQFARRTEYVV